MYQIRRFLKFSELDVYREGCIPDTHNFCDVNISVHGNTIEDVIRQAKEFFGAKDEDLERNSCDEIGRLDICVLEDVAGSTLTESQINRWKKGKIRAWNCVYTGYVEKIERVKI